MNQEPFKNHKEIIGIYEQYKIEPNDENYLEKIINFSDKIRKYLISLNASKNFNTNIVHKITYNALNHTIEDNQSVDVTKIIGHVGHLKLDRVIPYTWEEILQKVLKTQTIYGLIDQAIFNKKLFTDSDRINLEVYKLNNNYYLNSSDGLHRLTLAKYVLSNNNDIFLNGIKVINLF